MDVYPRGLFPPAKRALLPVEAAARPQRAVVRSGMAGRDLRRRDWRWEDQQPLSSTNSMLLIGISIGFEVPLRIARDFA